MTKQATTINFDKLHIDEHYKSITIKTLLQRTDNSLTSELASKLKDVISEILHVFTLSVADHYQLEIQKVPSFKVIKVIKPVKPLLLELATRSPTAAQLGDYKYALSEFNNNALIYATKSALYFQYQDMYKEIHNYLRGIVITYVIAELSNIDTVPVQYRYNVIEKAKAEATCCNYGDYYYSLQMAIDEYAELFQVGV